MSSSIELPLFPDPRDGSEAGSGEAFHAPSYVAKHFPGAREQAAGQSPEAESLNPIMEDLGYRVEAAGGTNPPTPSFRMKQDKRSVSKRTDMTPYEARQQDHEAIVARNPRMSAPATDEELAAADYAGQGIAAARLAAQTASTSAAFRRATDTTAEALFRARGLPAPEIIEDPADHSAEQMVIAMQQPFELSESELEDLAQKIRLAGRRVVESVDVDHHEETARGLVAAGDTVQSEEISHDIA